MAEYQTPIQQFREFYRHPKNKRLVWSVVAGVLTVGGLAMGAIDYFSNLADRRIRKAERYLRNNEISRAIEEYKVIIDKYSRTEKIDDALFALGEIYETQDKPDQARPLYTRIKREYPQSNMASMASFRLADTEESMRLVALKYPGSDGAENAILALADQKAKDGDLDGARKLLVQLPVDFPEGNLHDAALFKLGEIDYKQARYGKAARSYRKLINEFHKSKLREAAYYALADSIDKGGDKWESVSAYQSALLAFPNNQRAEDVMFYVGQLYLELGEMNLLRDTYNKFNEKYPLSTKKGEVHQVIGKSYLAEGNYDKAIIEFENAIKNTDDEEEKGQALWNIAIANEQMSDFAQSEKILAYMINKFPEHSLVPSAEYKKAIDVFKQGENERAIIALSRVLEENPNHEKASEAQYLIGKANYNLKEYGKAIRAYQRVINLYLVSNFRDDAQFGICDVFYAQGDDGLARTAYLIAMDNFTASPYLVHAYYRIGDTFRNQGDHEKAIEYYLLAKNRFPDYKRAPEVTLWVADYHYNDRNFEKALVIYQEYFNEFKDGVFRDKALYRIGRCQYEMRDFEAAEKSFSRLLDEFSPGEYAADALYSLADTYYQRDNFLDSAQSYQQAETDFPQYMNRYYQLGRSEQHLRLFDRAIENYRKLAASDYNDNQYMSARFRIGYLLVEKGDYPEGRKFLKRFLTRYPGNKYVAAAQAKMGESYYKEDNFASAIEWFMKSDQTARLAKKERSRLASSLFREKRYEEAEESYLELILEAEGDREEELLHRVELADCYFASRKYKKALSVYERIISEYQELEINDERIQWAYYQKGNTLRELRRFDEAEKMYVYIAENYPDSLWAEQAAQEQLVVRWQKRQQEYFPEGT